MAGMLKSCPVCGHGLIATRLECDSCGVGVDGRFEPRGLAGLAPEQLDFVEVFVRNRGVIRDVESELGVSYPTVRARLDEVVEAMEATRMAASSGEDRRRRILAGLEEGEIDVDEALKRLSSKARSEAGPSAAPGGEGVGDV